MKIVFAYKGRYHIRDAITVEFLSAIAKKYNYETEIGYDQDLFGITDNVLSSSFLNKAISSDTGVVRSIVKKDPNIVVFLDGFARTAWNAQLAQEIKLLKSDVITVCCTHKEFEGSGAYDYVLVGEPEHAFERCLNERIFEQPKKQYHIPGLADLNELPLPDKELFSRYVNFRDSYLLYATKGCPYPCSYCEETLYKQQLGEGFYRRKSPERVIHELRMAKERFNIKEVIFKDSVFTWDKKWLLDYLLLYKKHINVPFKCFAKSHSFDDEMAQMLKGSGCYCVEFGVQTFNYKLKKDVLHRDEKVNTLLTAFSLCAKHKLRYDLDHMFGIPGESIEDHLMAAKAYLGLPYLNRIKCHNLVFYRGSAIFKRAPAYVQDNYEATSDFFSSVSGTHEMVRPNKAFQYYFKILPLLPKNVNLFIIKHKTWKIFGCIPYFVVIVLMLILAIKNRDRRFWLYFKYYPLKIKRAILA